LLYLITSLIIIIRTRVSLKVRVTRVRLKVRTRVIKTRVKVRSIVTDISTYILL
jgi:hypothetical protein